MQRLVCCGRLVDDVGELTRIADPRSLGMTQSRSDDITVRTGIVGIALEWRRPKPGAPAQAAADRIVRVEAARRRLVAGQHELDLEVELIVAEEARQGPERIVRLAAGKKLVVPPPREGADADAHAALLVPDLVAGHRAVPETAATLAQRRLRRARRADTTRRRTARPRTARRSSRTRAARAPPPAATASTAGRRSTAATRLESADAR